MNSKKMNKFDIDIEIKDLLWEFIRRWRLIVVLALICGVVLAAYQYRIDMNKTDVVTVKKTQEELEASMGKQDLDEVTAAVALKRQADEKSAYMDASILMRINPYEENVVLLQYHVKPASEAEANDANDAYVAYVNQGFLAKDLVETNAYDMDPVYLAELISIVKEEDTSYINAKSASDRMALTVEGSTEERVFTVKVIGTSKENAEAMAKDVKAALQEYSSLLVASIGGHKLQLLSENSTVIADQSLAELQNWNATSIKTISNNLDSMKNEMTGDQISLYTYRTTVVVDTVDTTATTTVTEKVITISMKHAVIGVIVGIVLACGVIFASYLFAAALRNGEEVKTLYGVKILGYVDDSAFQKKKVFGFVDKFIVKLQNIRKKTLTFDQEVQMIGANILLDCQKNDCKEIYLASSVTEAIPEAIVKAVIAKCEEKGIQVVMGNCISYDAEALEHVAKIGNVVFIEKKRVSLYDELYSEVALCRAHDINVIGMIVL